MLFNPSCSHSARVALAEAMLHLWKSRHFLQYFQVACPSGVSVKVWASSNLSLPGGVFLLLKWNVFFVHRP